MRKIFLLVIAILVVASIGCRTGEYKFDLEIYEQMPALLEANEDIASKIRRNDDGTLDVTYEKGEMFIRLAYQLDPNTQQKVVSQAFEIFHDQYINHPEARNKEGKFRRQSIRARGFVDDIELYVVRWDLADPEPDLESDRYASYY